MRIDKEYTSWVAAFAVIAAAAFLLFGITGFRTVSGFAVIFILPLLLIIRQLGFDAEESVFFSLFISLGLFAMLLWLINQALPSFRVSVALALLLLAGLAFLLPRISGRLQKKPQQPAKAE